LNAGLEIRQATANPTLPACQQPNRDVMQMIYRTTVGGALNELPKYATPRILAVDALSCPSDIWQFWHYSTTLRHAPPCAMRMEV
jgi:hypothetical protein